MHLEIDVLEVAFLIFMYITLKWLFRFFIMIFVIKVIANIKEKAVEKVVELKKTVNREDDKERDLPN